eukprot:765503-Hanusia_phi.AAC.1
MRVLSTASSRAIGDLPSIAQLLPVMRGWLLSTRSPSALIPMEQVSFLLSLGADPTLRDDVGKVSLPFSSACLLPPHLLSSSLLPPPLLSPLPVPPNPPLPSQLLPSCSRITFSQVPYELCKGKDERDAFRRFWASEPDKWDYSKSQIPSMLTPEMEEQQKQKGLSLSLSLRSRSRSRSPSPALPCSLIPHVAAEKKEKEKQRKKEQEKRKKEQAKLKQEEEEKNRAVQEVDLLVHLLIPHAPLSPR